MAKKQEHRHEKAVSLGAAPNHASLVIHLFNHAMAAQWIRRGVHFVLFGTNRRALSEGFHADFEYLRHINGPRSARPRAKLRVVKGAKGGGKGPDG
jgi:hypothetical protein